MEVISVNHGRQFGHDSWYTFYCPQCSKQVSPQQKDCGCGCEIEWSEDKEDE